LKLLFNDNLSWRLERFLQKTFPGSKHVRSFEKLPDPAKDIQIREYALNNNFIIVTSQ
jgi:predicted nuclease of predicted toxin-antitoxin system